ncbi:hypothetical protein STANM309S_02946 [Streptomyces tanashiensis]
MRTVGRNCSFAETDLKLEAADGTRGNVLSDTATAYDGLAWTTTMKPAKGLPTWVGRAKSYGTGGAVTWDKGTTTAYDALGRPTKVTNADQKATTTAYTPPDAGPLTKTVQANAVSHQSVTFIDPRRGLPQRLYDANLKKTELRLRRARPSDGRLAAQPHPRHAEPEQLVQVQPRRHRAVMGIHGLPSRPTARRTRPATRSSTRCCAPSRRSRPPRRADGS